MTYEERVQFNNMSKLVYGKTSKWRTIMKNGEEADMEEVMEDGTVRKYRGIKYPSPDEVKAKMEKIWAEEQARIKAVAEKDAKKEQEAALDTMVAEGEKLGLYDEPLTDLEAEAIRQREMIKQKASS